LLQGSPETGGAPFRQDGLDEALASWELRSSTPSRARRHQDGRGGPPNVTSGLYHSTEAMPVEHNLKRGRRDQRTRSSPRSYSSAPRASMRSGPSGSKPLSRSHTSNASRSACFSARSNVTADFRMLSARSIFARALNEPGIGRSLRTSLAARSTGTDTDSSESRKIRLSCTQHVLHRGCLCS
jgi:hypothetical protein